MHTQVITHYAACLARLGVEHSIGHGKLFQDADNRVFLPSYQGVRLLHISQLVIMVLILSISLYLIGLQTGMIYFLAEWF